ncbi:MAG: hypothetical protein M3680_15520 [Myxococcota bacterium]|nr:hypothetical protein [Myxococcota bacterium]
MQITPSAACAPDPIVGTWTADSKLVEFHDDGTLTGIQRNDPDCGSETAAIAACARRQRWSRSGSAYRITLMGLIPRRPGDGSLLGLFDAPKRPDGSACECVVDISATAELRGNELVFDGGKERIHRVRSRRLAWLIERRSMPRTRLLRWHVSQR